MRTLTFIQIYSLVLLNVSSLVTVPLKHIKYIIMTNTFFQLTQLRNIKNMYRSRSNVDNYLHSQRTQSSSFNKYWDTNQIQTFPPLSHKTKNQTNILWKEKSPQEKDRLKYQTIPSKNKWSHHKGRWRAHEIQKYIDLSIYMQSLSHLQVMTPNNVCTCMTLISH